MLLDLLRQVGPDLLRVYGLMAFAAFVYGAVMWRYRARTPPPPPVDGLGTAGPEAARIVCLWQRNACWHLVRHRRLRWKAIWWVSLVMLILRWVLFWLFIPAQKVVMARPWVRYYTDGGTYLAIAATGSAWRIEDHIVKELGAKHGEPFRKALAAGLQPVADSRGITVTATAAHASLVPLYQDVLPFREVGRAFPRGVRLRYDPPSASRGTGGGGVG